LGVDPTNSVVLRSGVGGAGVTTSLIRSYVTTTWKIDIVVMIAAVMIIMLVATTINDAWR
jgi:3-oxoacyl-ACP reductase-like protein